MLVVCYSLDTLAQFYLGANDSAGRPALKFAAKRK